MWEPRGDLVLRLNLFDGKSPCSLSPQVGCRTQHFTVGFLLAPLLSFVQSILRFPDGQSELKLRSLPVKGKVQLNY